MSMKGEHQKMEYGIVVYICIFCMFTECFFFFFWLSYSYLEVGQKSLRNIIALIHAKLLERGGSIKDIFQIFPLFLSSCIYFCKFLTM